MASENTRTNVGNDEETGPLSEPNEHDYAHNNASNLSSSSGTPVVDGGVTAQDNFTVPVQPTASLTVELPEPAVGAEVDCPAGTEEVDCSGGNDVEIISPPSPRVVEDPTKSAAPDFVVTPGAPAIRRGRRRARRPEDSNCCCCKLAFERQGRSFNRRAVYTFTTPETVQWAFPGSMCHKKSFLCETCAQVIRTKCSRKNTGKRSMWLKPPLKKQVCIISVPVCRSIESSAY